MTDDAGGGKCTVAKSLDLPVSAAEVWKMIGDFNGLHRWAAGVERSDLSNGGKRRTLTLKVGGTVVEDLLEHDDKGRSCTYSIVQSAVPAEQHKATLSVTERGPSASTVHWRCEFKPKGADLATVTGIFTGIFERSLAQLEQTFRK